MDYLSFFKANLPLSSSRPLCIKELNNALEKAKSDKNNPAYQNLLILKKRSEIIAKNADELEFLLTGIDDKFASSLDWHFSSFVKRFLNDPSQPLKMTKSESKKVYKEFKELKAKQPLLYSSFSPNVGNILVLSLMGLMAAGLGVLGVLISVGALLSGPLGFFFAGLFLLVLAVLSIIPIIFSLQLQYKGIKSKQISVLADTIKACMDDSVKQELMSDGQFDETLFGDPQSFSAAPAFAN